jgi:hypothetical protein
MKLDEAILWSKANAILNTISNPKLLEKLIAVKALPKEERINAATQNLTLPVFAKAKIKIPEGALISSQYFEEKVELDFLFQDSKNGSLVAPTTRETEPASISKLKEGNPKLFEQIIVHQRSVGGEVSYSMCLYSGEGAYLGIGSGRAGSRLNRNPTMADIARLHHESKQGYEEIIQFVKSPEFNSIYKELMDLSNHDQPEFVVNVLLNDIELQNRGVNRPKNLFIMRTAFGDRRPTLFCVKKWLSRDLNVFWENVNINFVNKSEKEMSDKTSALRSPTPVAIQHEYLSGKLTKKEVDEALNVLDLMADLTF